MAGPTELAVGIVASWLFVFAPGIGGRAAPLALAPGPLDEIVAGATVVVIDRALIDAANQQIAAVKPVVTPPGERKVGKRSLSQSDRFTSTSQRSHRPWRSVRVLSGSVGG